MREIITVHERICKHKTGAGSGCGWRHECLLARLRLGRLTFLTDEAFTNEALTGVEGEQGADRIAGRIFRRQSAPWLRVVKACFFIPWGSPSIMSWPRKPILGSIEMPSKGTEAPANAVRFRPWIPLKSITYAYRSKRSYPRNTRFQFTAFDAAYTAPSTRGAAPFRSALAQLLHALLHS
jgi:hypothetical protein